MTHRASDFWDRETVQPTHMSWMAELPVRIYINTSISGREGGWPLDWFQENFPRRFRRALSIGCGTGPFERDLIVRDLCDAVDAFDGSVGSLAVASQEARRAGMAGRIRYFAGDFNEPVIPPRTYDLVIFHQSLHHVSNMERLLRVVLRALRPDGLLYVDEYVGPSRFDWNDELLSAQRAVYSTVPAEARVYDTLPYPVQEDDPSEAVRSSAILPQLSIGFVTQAFRGYGGNLLTVLFPAIRWQSAPAGLLESLIRAEADLLAAGAAPYYAVLVARPRRGLGFLYANLRYIFERRLRRWWGSLTGRA